jgi:energy-coupling factor transport system ATP-binding protein
MVEQAIRLEGVSFSYPQDGRGLPPFSLEVNAGEGVLLSGPSGCGKSTLARLACGLIPHLYHGKLQGHAWLNSLPTVDTPLWKLSEQAGLVFQNPAAQILTSSVEEEILFGLENLGISRREMATRLEETLQRFQLLDMRDRSPQTLSGGEQQKLALACMLARRMPVLVLDEPLSMLDSTFAHQLTSYLGDLLDAGHTLMICEHRAVFLRHIAALRTIPLASPHPPPDDHLPAGEAPVLREPSAFTLRVEQLSVERGGQTVLQEIDFCLPGGHWVALIGRNGSGKTTLLRTLAGLQPYQGRLQVQTASGVDAPSMSMVFQNPDLQLFNPTVRDEILYRIPNPDMQWYAWLVRALGLLRYEDTPPFC